MDWGAFFQAVAGDFTDLAGAQPLAQALTRLLLAALLGGCIGFQRERDGHEAGTRTHALVVMGSAILVLVPQQMGLGADAVSRIVQGLLAGIGFLGAGAILKRPSKEYVAGMTTAAGIWMTAAIGVAVGLGRGATAILWTVLTIVVLEAEAPLRRLVDRHRKRPPDGGS